MKKKLNQNHYINSTIKLEKLIKQESPFLRLPHIKAMKKKAYTSYFKGSVERPITEKVYIAH